MKGIIDLEVYTNKIKFSLTIRRKITVIRGDSGTGKSLLCDLIERSRTDHSITVKCEHKVVTINSLINVKYELPLYENMIVFVDEFSGLLRDEDFLKGVLNVNARFVFISRDETYINTSYSSKEIYAFKRSGKFVSMERLYTGIVNSKRFRSIVTEDSESGFDFFNNMVMDVKDGGGNDKIAAMLRDSRNFGKLYVFDSANFGRQFPEAYVLAVRGLIDLSDVESFEYMLLNSSTFLNSKYADRIINPELYEADSFITWEEYFEWLLNDILIHETGMGYSKDRECCCATRYCCYYGVPCSLKSYIIDKSLDVLEHNGLDYLVVDRVSKSEKDVISVLRRMAEEYKGE